MKFALVGLGNAGQNIHLPALKGLAGAELVGGCDPDAKRREAAEAKFGLKTFETYDAMMEAAKPEAVVIGTPPDSHRDYCLKSLAAGAHVVCEKPFVSSLAEADEVIEAAARAGRQVALNHEFREMPIFRALRDELGKPEVGAPVFAQVWQLMNLAPWMEPGWRGQMLQRTLYEAGVHLVDYAMALFGEKPVAVSATTSTCGEREGKTDAVALATLEFSRGRLAQIIQDRLCKGDTQYFEARVDAQHRSLRASYGGRARVSAGMLRSTKPHVRVEYGAAGLAWIEEGHSRRVIAKNPKDPVTLATRLLFERTIAAFERGGKPPATAQDGRDVLEVIAACYRSAETGRRLEMASDEVKGLRELRMGAQPA